MTYTVATLIGSLRRESFTRKIANAFMELAPHTLTFETIEIGSLPLYSQDLEDAPARPAEWIAFREGIRSKDALLFATPEYNRSVPGVLPRSEERRAGPESRSRWAPKPSTIISVTTGGLGAFGANHHLRQSLMAVNVAAMAHPEAYIANA
ncbi:MAG: NADPH-dependent FMN reductase, partial [Gemmatimonadota bacterium]